MSYPEGCRSARATGTRGTWGAGCGRQSVGLYHPPSPGELHGAGLGATESSPESALGKENPQGAREQAGGSPAGGSRRGEDRCRREGRPISRPQLLDPVIGQKFSSYRSVT